MGPSKKPSLKEIIKTAVRKLKNSKAPCYDNIVNKHISSTLPIFLHVYMKFFDMIFELALFQMNGYLE